MQVQVNLKNGNSFLTPEQNIDIVRMVLPNKIKSIEPYGQTATVNLPKISFEPKNKETETNI